MGDYYDDYAARTEADVLADGTQVLTEADGSQYQISPDGTIYAVTADGVVSIMDINGNVLSDSTQSNITLPSQSYDVVGKAGQLATQITALANVGYKLVKDIQTAKATGGANLRYTTAGQPYVQKTGLSSMFANITPTMMLAIGGFAFLAMRRK